MREIRLHGSEGGGTGSTGAPYPYRSQNDIGQTNGTTDSSSITYLRGDDTTEFLNSPQSVQKIEFLSFGRAILTLSTLRVELYSELWPEPVWRWYQGGRTLWYCTTSARWLSARGYQISKLAFPSHNTYADVRVGIEARTTQNLHANSSAEMATTPATRAHRA